MLKIGMNPEVDHWPDASTVRVAAESDLAGGVAITIYDFEDAIAIAVRNCYTECRVIVRDPTREPICNLLPGEILWTQTSGCEQQRH